MIQQQEFKLQKFYAFHSKKVLKDEAKSFSVGNIFIGQKYYDISPQMATSLRLINIPT